MNNKTYSVVEVLYKDHSKFLAFAISLLKDKALAEDIVQDVFLQLLTSNSNHLIWIFSEGKGVSYINKIIAVRCLSKKSQFYKKNILYVKNKIKVEPKELEYLYHKIHAENFSVSNLLLDKINKELKKFSEYERDLFLLYYESGFTYEELSKEVGIPKISIYNTIRKVKKKIKQNI